MGNAPDRPPGGETLIVRFPTTAATHLCLLTASAADKGQATTPLQKVASADSAAWTIEPGVD